MAARHREPPGPPALCIVGRSSSHYTRLARIFAEEMSVGCGFSPVFDMASLDLQHYGGNPALKLPVLTGGGGAIFGTENICRALTEAAARPSRIVWPEGLHDATARNAQELVWHGMQAQVQLAFGTLIAHLPADSIYFTKAASGLRNALQWLDERIAVIMPTLPPRNMSMLEASLFCLVEHLAFRRTLTLEPYKNLSDFVCEFGLRRSAQNTPYHFDSKPVG